MRCRASAANAFLSERPQEKATDIGRKRGESWDPGKLVHLGKRSIRRIAEAQLPYRVLDRLVSLSLAEDAGKRMTPEEEHVEQQHRETERIVLCGAPDPGEALAL